MVGVPRSKGCLTCRRRKVACDQAKPHCQKCVKRGVPCEGYARYPTILQYTGGGLKKRCRFEDISTAGGSSLAFEVPGPASPSHLISLQSFPAQPSAGRLILSQVGMVCMNTYVPDVGSAGAMPELKRNWMWMMLDKPDQGSALGASFAALCFGRVGICHQDEALVRRAQTQYALGLSALQCALQKPHLAFQDQTLAAIRTLSIYEISSLPGTHISQAYVHEAGMAQWCLAAGPERINTQFALQVFHDVRWCLMIRAIEGRVRSCLDTKEWRTVPWRFFAKDSLQCLFDLGFEIAGLLQQLDVCNSRQLPETSVSNRARLSLRCAVVQTKLDEWHSTNWSNHIGPSLWKATNRVYFWLFKMVFNEAMAATALDSDQDEFMFLSLELAIEIVSASSFFLADAAGWLGPQRFYFPLKRAMALLVRQRSPFAEDAKQAFGKVIAKLRSGCD